MIALSLEFGQGVTRLDWLGFTSEYFDIRFNIQVRELTSRKEEESGGKGSLEEENRVWLIFRAHQVAKFGASFVLIS